MTRLIPSYTAWFLVLAALCGAGADARRQSSPPPEQTAVNAARPRLPSNAVPTYKTPLPGRVITFDNWAVGCDNMLSCTAISLLPEDADQPYPVIIEISRAAGPDSAVTLRLLADEPLKGKIDILADEKRLARIRIAGDSAILAGDDALGIVQTLGRSYSFEVSLKQTISKPSLTGLLAALRYVDERQGRVGAENALAAIGSGKGSRTQQPDATVIPVEAPKPDLKAMPLTPTEEAAARRIAICESNSMSALPIEVHALDETHDLALLPCDAGAYNISMVPLVTTRGNDAQRSLAIARFDYMPGSSGEPGAPPLIVNARWNPARGELSSLAKGRGLGDCGTTETYRWDGAFFRLIDARAMPMCRGAWEWPRIWTAKAEPVG